LAFIRNINIYDGRNYLFAYLFVYLVHPTIRVTEHCILDASNKTPEESTDTLTNIPCICDKPTPVSMATVDRIFLMIISAAEAVIIFFILCIMYTRQGTFTNS